MHLRAEYLMLCACEAEHQAESVPDILLVSNA
jgi:hypothetical protein